MSSPLRASVRVKVPFHDCDPMGIVWHGNYAKYFELARCELLDAVGYGYRRMQQSEYGWPVVDFHARYVQATRFEQELEVAATLLEWDLRILIGYEIRDAATRARVTKGRSVQAAVSRRDGTLLLGIPQEFRQAVAAALGESASSA